MLKGCRSRNENNSGREGATAANRSRQLRTDCCLHDGLLLPRHAPLPSSANTERKSNQKNSNFLHGQKRHRNENTAASQDDSNDAGTATVTAATQPPPQTKLTSITDEKA
eukprot:2220652-Rhodomonas_salina.2